MKKNRPVMIGVFNSGYVIALLLFLAGSVGSLCDGVIASRGLGVAELAAVGLVYPYTKTMECISLLFSSCDFTCSDRRCVPGKGRLGSFAREPYRRARYGRSSSLVVPRRGT